MKQFQYQITTKDGKYYEFFGHLESFDNKFLVYENKEDTFFLRLERDNVKSIVLIPCHNN